MAYENFTLEVDGDGIALVTWDMPNRSMNVLSDSSLRELGEIVQKVAGDDAIKGAVITSGKDAFCAGADLGEMGGNAGGGEGASKQEKLAATYKRVYGLNQMFRTLETCGKPIAAAINGTALGGGLEVTLACHYRVVADNDRIQLGLPEAKVGLLPGGGGTQRLPRLIGAGAALPLILEGKNLRPGKAAEQGVVHKVVPADELVAEAKRWIKEEGDPVQPWDKKGYKVPGGGPYDKEGGSTVFVMGNAMLRKQTYGNYPAQINIMKCVYEGIQVPIDAGLRIESRYFADLLMRPESKGMIRSLFLSMQELSKGARRPQSVDKIEVKKVGVLGAGLMGAGIAYVSAKAGIEVVLIDRDQGAADKGKDYSVKLLDKDLGRGRIDEAGKQKVLGLITPTTDYDALKGADLVIEAVFEDREIKADVTKKAEAVMGEDAVFGSNTSTLPITGLAEASSRPEHFIGIHFFSPVEKMNLVEMIMGEKTGDRALAAALDYTKKIKKTPIVVNDSRGFYTSRCVGTFMNEGFAMLGEGVSPAMVENAARMAGMPMGALELGDSVGMDTALKIARTTEKETGRKVADTPGGQAMIWIVDDHGRPGRKAGKGFYDYDDKGKRLNLWPEVYGFAREQAGGKSAEDADIEVLKQRYLTIQALEAARCFEEKVVTDVREADVGAILGWGFAPFTGGPISYIDMVGTKEFVERCERFAAAYGPRFEPCALLKDMAQNGDTFYTRFNPKQRDEVQAAE